MTEDKKKPIDRFAEEVTLKKQHVIDSTLDQLKRDVKKYKDAYEELRVDFDSFKKTTRWLDLLEHEFIEPTPIVASSKTGTAEGTLIGVASDWHVFEVVDPLTVSYLNEHNKEIARQRVLNFFDGSLAWANVLESKVSINNFVLALLGDHITGMLHEDQVETNEGTPMEEILYALDLVIQGINMLKDHGNFDKITVLCCDGNHSRDSKEGYKRASTRVRHSYEWLMYQFLNKLYADDNQVEFQIAEGYHLYQDIYDTTIRFHHGDAIKYYGGIGGLTIPANKSINEWNKGRKADLDIFAHWHLFMNPDLFLCNGSTVGYSAYSIKQKLGYQKPQQSLVLVDSKRGITSVNRIYV